MKCFYHSAVEGGCLFCGANHDQLSSENVIQCYARQLVQHQELFGEVLEWIKKLKAFINSDDVNLRIRDLPTEFEGYEIFRAIDALIPKLERARKEEV